MAVKLAITGFVEWLQKQLRDGVGYVMGAIGQTLTMNNLRDFAD